MCCHSRLVDQSELYRAMLANKEGGLETTDIAGGRRASTPGGKGKQRQMRVNSLNDSMNADGIYETGEVALGGGSGSTASLLPKEDVAIA